MSTYADNIRAAAGAHYRPGLQDTSALDLQAVAGEIAAAVDYLESLQRGAQISFGAGAPGAQLGEPGDAYLATVSGDVYGYDAGTGWQLKGNLRGKDGKNGKAGTNGTTPVKGVDYTDGANGKSTFELYQQTGGQLGLLAWLDSLPGKDGANGAAGSLIRWESVAPTASDAGAVGDTWFFAKAADKVLIYECYRTAAVAAQDLAGGGQWRLRFTSPDAPTGTGTGTGTGTANFPPQTPATTTGKSLMSTGTAGAEYWGYPNRVSYPLEFLQLTQARKKHFQAALFTRFERDAAVATLAYSVNGGADVAVPFNGANVYTPPAPIAIPAGALVVWTITYTSSASEAFGEVFAVETLP